MMFPPNGGSGWTLAEIDALDVHFFTDIMSGEEIKEEQYLSDLW